MTGRPPRWSPDRLQKPVPFRRNRHSQGGRHPPGFLIWWRRSLTDNRRRRGRADRIRVAGGERYEAQLVARKFRVGLAVVLSVIKRVGNLRSRGLRRTQATDVQASSRGEEEVRRVSDGRSSKLTIRIVLGLMAAAVAPSSRRRVGTSPQGRACAGGRLRHGGSN